MRYFLDCEFDGFGGPLISLALVREDGESIYLVYQQTAKDPWVQKNVLPILWDIPSPMPGMAYELGEDQSGEWQPQPRAPRMTPQVEGAHRIANFLKGDDRPYIITDWPDDVRYFCGTVITAPGEMVSIPSLRFEVVRVDAYPSVVPGAVQHNAWWDAKSLMHLLLP